MNKFYPSIILVCIFCLFILPSAASSSGSTPTIEYTEWDGHIVHIPRNPKRTIILYNSLLELWLYCNGTAIGRVEGKQNLPEVAHGIEVLGSVGHPNIERLIDLKPDLVILSANMRSHKKIRLLLEENQVNSLMVRYDHYQDFFRIAKLFARINHSEKEIGLKIRAISDEIKSISQSCKKLFSPRVLILFSSANTLSCELPDGDTGRLVALLGGTNIAHKIHIKGIRRVDINLEFIVQQDPDIILIKTMGDVEKCQERIRKEYARNPAWAQIKAVRLQRVYVLPKSLFLYKPNHRYPKSLYYLADLLYPDNSPHEQKEGKD